MNLTFLTKLVAPALAAVKFLWTRKKRKEQFEEAFEFALAQATNAAPAHRDTFTSQAFTAEDLRPLARRAAKQPAQAFTGEQVAALYRKRFPATKSQAAINREHAEISILSGVFVTAFQSKLLAASEWADLIDRRQGWTTQERVALIATDIPALDWTTTALMVRRWLSEAFASRLEARKRLGQPLQINAPDLKINVPRPAIERAIGQALVSDIDVPVLVVGEDGVGKSWSTARALDTLPLSNDIVLMISSRELTPHQDLAELLSETLRTRTRSGTQEGWRQLLQSWFPDPPETPDPRRLVLVLDGLNENHLARWRNLLVEARTPRWLGRLKLCLSARPGLAQQVRTQCAILDNVPTWIQVSPFDDDELSLALAAVGRSALVQKLAGGSLEALLRTPRYFEVASRLWDQVADDAQVTVNRLILEDLRTQVNFSDNKLEPSAWEALLAELGGKWLQGARNFNLSDVQSALASSALAPDQIDAGLAQIREGRLFPRIGTKISLDEALAPLAIGMALIEDLLAQGLGDVAAVIEALDVLLPNLGADKRAEALAAAAAIAFCWSVATPDPTTLRAGLLGAWLTSQNLSPDTEGEVNGYVTADAAAYADAFEWLVTKAAPNRMAITLVEEALRQAVNDPAVEIVALERAQRWSGYVGLADQHQPNNLSVTGVRGRRLNQTLGTLPGPGRQLILGADIEFLPGPDQPFLLHLAAMLMRNAPLAAHVQAFRNAAVAMAVGHSHAGIDELRWTARLNTRDPEFLDAALRAAAGEIAGLADPERPSVAQAAAAYLLNFIGDDADQPAIDRLDRLGDLDSGQLYARYLSDPAGAHVTLERRHVQAVSRSLLPAHRLLDRLKVWMWDPTVQFATSLTSKARQAAKQQWAPAQLAAHMGQTAEDIAFRDLEPVLARLDPILLGQQIADFAREVSLRSDTGLRFGAVMLRHRLASLKTSALDALQSLLALRATVPDKTEHDGHTNRNLFDMLAWRMTAIQQLDLILSPGCDGVHYTTEPLLKPADTAQVEARLASVTGEMRNLLFAYLALTDLTPSPAILDALHESIADPDANRAAHAMTALARHGNAESARRLVDADWRWRPGEEQSSHSGSLILIRYGKGLAFSIVLDRIAPWLLPLAVRERGALAEEIAAAATVLRQALLGPHEAPSLDDVAVLTVIVAASEAGLTSMQVQLPDRGRQDAEAMTLMLDGEKRLAALNAAAARASQLITEAHAQGAVLYARAFDADLLAPFGDAVAAWAEDLLQDSQLQSRARLHAAGLLIAMSGLLLRDRPQLGARFWRANFGDAEATGYRDWTGASARLKALFAAPPSPERDALIGEVWDIGHTGNDAALFAVVFAAESAGDRETLDNLIGQDASSPRPYRRARALVATSFRSDAPVDQNQRLGSQMTWLWLIQVRQKAAERAARNAAARGHFRSFLNASNDDDALGAWLLLLQTVDRRFRLWCGSEIAAAGKLRPQRQAHLDLNLDEIKSAIAENEKELSKSFLNFKL